MTEKPSMWRELREGLEFLVRHRYWRPISITTASSNFFWTMCGSIIIVYAVRELDLSPAVIGLTFSLGSIGGLIGAFIGRPVSARFGVGPTIVASAVLFGPALMLVPLAPQSFPIPLLVASFILAGVELCSTTSAPSASCRRSHPSGCWAGSTPHAGSSSGARSRSVRSSVASLPSVIGLHRRSGWEPSAHTVCFIPCAVAAPSPPRDADGFGARSVSAARTSGLRARLPMPELPEVEAWVRELDPLVSAAPIEQAGPAHIATLKTFDPPLSALDGRRLEGAERRGRTSFPRRGRRPCPARPPDERRPAPVPRGEREEAKAPMFRLRFEGGAELVLTEAGRRSGPACGL